MNRMAGSNLKSTEVEFSDCNFKSTAADFWGPDLLNREADEN